MRYLNRVSASRLGLRARRRCTIARGSLDVLLDLGQLGVLGGQLGLGGVQLCRRDSLSLRRSHERRSLVGKGLFALLVLAGRTSQQHESND